MNLAREEFADKAKILEILAAGARLWRASHDEPPDLRDAILELLAEASRTMRAIVADRPRGYGVSWPPIVFDAAEIVAAYNQQLEELREAEKDGRLAARIFSQRAGPPPQPSAAAMSRFDRVVTWLRLIPSPPAQKARRMELLLALAGGLSLSKATRISRFAALGIATRAGMQSFRDRALSRIEERLRLACPGFRDALAQQPGFRGGVQGASRMRYKRDAGYKPH